MTLAVAPCSWDLTTVCCSTWNDYSDTIKTQATSYATLVLWAATGRQYGLCEQVVRPCGRECWNCPNGYYWSGGTWVPYIWNGTWFNGCGCGFGSGCQTCRPDCVVYLPGPVASVSEVIVDGLTVDPAEYIVYDGRWLTRLSTTDCWPICGDFNVTSGTGFFQVTYTRGTAVPAPLLNAAGTLACEYAKACLGEACQLPSRVVSIARQGVSVNLVDVDKLLERNLTGITTVDQVIAALNPHGLKGRTRLYSPDIPAVRMVTS
jgi:hypothetical protein